MSLTKDRLKQIIKEELSALLNEEVKSAKETLEDLGFRVDGDFEEGELEDVDREKDIDFLKLKDGTFRMTVREEASDGGYDVSTHDHDSLDGLVQHIQRELGEDDLMEASAGPWKGSPTEAAYGVYKNLEELKKRAEEAYDKYVKKGWKMPAKDQYVKNYLTIANEMGLDKALDKHRLIAREATFTRIDDPVKMSDFLLGKG